MRIKSAKLVIVDRPGNRRVFPADRAVRILADVYAPEFSAERIVEQEFSDQRITFPKDQFEALHRLERADDPADHAQDAAFGTARHRAGWRRLRVEAAVAWSACRIEDADLPLEPEDASVHVRFLQKNADIVHQVARREIVRAVNDDVIILRDIHGVLRREPRLIGDELYLGVELGDFFGRRNDFRPPDVARKVEDLPLKVAEIDHVEIDHPDRPDPRRREVVGQRRTQTAGADQQDLGGLDLLLAGDADLRENQMPAVAADLFICQFHRKG